MREHTLRGTVILLAPVIAAGTLAFSPGGAHQEHGDSTVPRVYDERLQLTVFASTPDIVTPIGIAVDRANRVYVLESHTHLQPAGYTGPKGDRIKVFTDADRDGTPERITIFADDIHDGMNLAFSPAGELYVVAAKGVWALHDRDRDGVSETRTAVLRMTRPETVYDHAALLGIAFSPDGWLYVSRGNTGSSPWRVEGTDGSRVSGYGDGGNILRSRPDGTAVEEVATGFWNPFDLRFDARGRLLAADNDPDSRGPNRLVHVLPGGDYGYKSLYGGSGIHPYLAWNGELPGTLPYAAALGEAPAGMLVANTAALPKDYLGDLLVAIWEERTIVRVTLQSRGTSVTGHPKVIVEGGDRFRPVAFAADGYGTIYITDWVVREYPNHGQGRIWRLTTRHGVDTLSPRPTFAAPEPDPDGEPLRRIYVAQQRSDFDQLRRALTSEDPFVRSAAITVLSTPLFRERVVAATEALDARVRLGALLALQRGGYSGGEPIARRLVTDPDLLVRRMALIWAGTAGMTSLEPALQQAILTDPPRPELFEVYLATLQLISPDFIRAYSSEAAPYARLLKRVLRPRLVESFIADRSKPVALRAMAIAHLEDLPSQVPLLAALAAPGVPAPMRLEAIRSLAMVPTRAAGAALLAIVRASSNPADLRAESLLGLARQPVAASADALTLLDDPAPGVRLEAARYLRSVTLSDATQAALSRKASTLTGPDAALLKAQLAFATGTAARPAPPAGSDEWHEAARAGGNPEAGRRVFFSSPSACSHCHVVERRGGGLGPDLTNIGRSKTRRQILDSILRPSAEITPDYQGWFVRTRDGQVHTGRQIDVGSNGEADLYTISGTFVTLEGITEYGPMPQSLMPPGLETNLTVDDMRDLLAFLEQRR